MTVITFGQLSRIEGQIWLMNLFMTKERHDSRKECSVDDLPLLSTRQYHVKMTKAFVCYW